MIEEGAAKRLIHEKSLSSAALAEYCNDSGTFHKFFFIPSDRAT